MRARLRRHRREVEARALSQRRADDVLAEGPEPDYSQTEGRVELFGAREKRRGMTGPLPNERIEQDCGGRRDEKTGGENAQIAPAPPPCPACIAPSCGQQLLPHMFQFRSRFGQNKIMIGGGQDFTQFSSPSFARKGHADQRQTSAQSSLSWPGFPPSLPKHGNRAAAGHGRWFLCPVRSPP